MEERNFNNGGKFFNGNNNGNNTNFVNPQPQVTVPDITTSKKWWQIDLDLKDIGIGAGAVAVLGLGFWGWRKYRKSKKKNNVVIPEEVKE